jgi:predicted outer membrane repeat protein
MGASHGQWQFRAASRPILEILEDRKLLAKIFVNTFDDLVNPPAGTISLRSALAMANTGRQHDTIVLPPGTYPTAGGFQVLARRSVTILSTGDGAKIAAEASSDSVFVVHSGASASFINLTITGGTGHPIDGGKAGGAVFNAGVVLLADCTISNNHAENGGGIYNHGDLTIDGNSSILNNTAGFLGGGIDNHYSGVSVGGDSRSLRIRDSVIEGNAASAGGGVYNETGGATIARSRIVNNNASNGGGLYNQDDLTVDDSTILNNTATTTGGGIASSRLPPSVGVALLIRKSIIEGNNAPRGGGVGNSHGNAEIIDSRLVGNTRDDLTYSPRTVKLSNSMVGVIGNSKRT